ncbi:MAG: SDR family NAD(P)-dependent oxidoreductase [Rhodospirillaceae bacterium]|nr:SDR family NAD(P)-dependent oxidoreductase [Rhodospirillaceae bacterium]
MAAKTAVITGSTRGIGFGLAKQFIMRGHSVVVSGRSQDSANKAAAELQAFATGGAKATGIACDITDIAQVEALWSSAQKALGRIDIWINNAGAINTMRPIGELDPADIMAVPRTNLIGTALCCQVALRGMNAQEAVGGIKGALYNFEGFGSDGAKSEGMSIYGASKFGLTYFTKTLIKETKGGQVLVGLLSPGMVTTEMLLKAKHDVSPERWARMKRLYRILANDVDTVTAWLVDNVLANTKHGAHIAWLTRGKAVLRFFKALVVKPTPLPELEVA